MSLSNKELILDVMREQGKTDALSLRGRAANMTGTEVIAEEGKVPLFESGKDYSGWAVGAPVGEIVDGEIQIYKWITPVNTANYPGMLPSNSPALLSPCHTTDQAKAKPWLAPNGTSGLYAVDEVCSYNGHIWRNLCENNEYPPETQNVEDRWEDLGEITE